MRLINYLDASNPCRFDVLNIDGEVVETSSALQMRSDSLHLASKLKSVGKLGDRVVIPPLPGIDVSRAFFAVVAAGMVAVPLSKMPKAGSQQFKYFEKVIADCEPAIIICDVDAPIPESFNLRVVDIEFRGTEDFVFHSEMWPANDDETVLIQYTSGSTGDPKGVCISERNLIINQTEMSAQSGVGQRSNVVNWLPSYHNMGLYGMTVVPAVSRASLVRIATEDFIRRPLMWIEAISNREDVCAIAPDFAYLACARAIKNDPATLGEVDLSGWNVAATGSEPIRESTLKMFTDAFSKYGFREEAFTPAYGLTESTSCVSIGRKDQKYKKILVDGSKLALGEVSLVNSPEDATELIGCGSPIHSSKVRILDPEGTDELPSHRIGEICISGASVVSGYWNNQNSETFAADDHKTRFLRTGDIGFIYGGELFVCGRKKDLLIHAGENYFASDLEAAALDAFHAYEHAVCACFQALDGKVHFVYEVEQQFHKELEKNRCVTLTQTISKIYPGAIEVSAVAFGELPRTANGKVRRQETAHLFAAGNLKVIATTVK